MFCCVFQLLSKKYLGQKQLFTNVFRPFKLFKVCIKHELESTTIIKTICTFTLDKLGHFYTLTWFMVLDELLSRKRNAYSTTRPVTGRDEILGPRERDKIIKMLKNFLASLLWFLFDFLWPLNSKGQTHFHEEPKLKLDQASALRTSEWNFSFDIVVIREKLLTLKTGDRTAAWSQITFKFNRFFSFQLKIKSFRFNFLCFRVNTVWTRHQDRWFSETDSSSQHVAAEAASTEGRGQRGPNARRVCLNCYQTNGDRFRQSHGTKHRLHFVYLFIYLLFCDTVSIQTRNPVMF